MLAMSTIYVLKEGQKIGPFTTEELEDKVVEGLFSREDLFWTEGMDDWEPLSTVIEAVAESAPDLSIQEDALYNAGGTVVTSQAVHLSGGEEIPVAGISKVAVQSERIKRFKPVAGCIVVGVVIVCFALLEIPRITPTHWILWGLVLLGLALWWVRLLLLALRIPATLVIIDLQNGDERIIRAKAREAKELCGAIDLARAESRPG